MPLPKIIAKAVVGSIKGKKAGQAAGTAAAKKAAAAKVAKAKAVAAKKDAAASARGLKAAQGPSMAPKGYVSDAARRKAEVKLNEILKTWGPSNARMLAGTAELMKTIKGPAPKNIVSKSGKKVIKPKVK
jgi:hypothetical protein